MSLDAYALKERVGAAFRARLDGEWPDCPTIGRMLTVEHRGSVSTLDVGAVRDLMERQRWEIVREVRSLGWHERDGEWALGEGHARTTERGTPIVGFLLTWSPRVARALES